VQQPDQWLLLSVFFLIFAGCGLFCKPKPANNILMTLFLGLSAIAINCVLLFIADRISAGSYPIMNLLTLKKITIESTIIIIGYCLVLKSLGQFLRSVITPSQIRSRNYL
jgi:hypothetical protein